LVELGGWDSFNVTEDADLGMRIYQRGWRTAILDSTTFEEATSKVQNWIRQRSRWVKGYIQTYFVHSRRPIRSMRQMGVKTFVTFQLFVGVGTLCLLVNPIYWILTLVWFLGHFHVIQQIFPPSIFYLGLAGLLIGNATFMLTTVAGCNSRGYYEDVKWAMLSPLYWILLSIGAWKGFLQLFTKPHYWEKTTHGYCLIDEDDTLERSALDPGDQASMADSKVSA
jgi:cellulose synthase/poly-beta-1,6-N-acetylglucosamine synthase-like glycosyltransferase